MLNVAYSKYMHWVFAVNIRQSIKNCAVIHFSTQYMRIILQKNQEKQTMP